MAEVVPDSETQKNLHGETFAAKSLGEPFLNTQLANPQIIPSFFL